MVKGTSRQVIVVQGAEPKLFEQAIFILREQAVEKGVTDEALLKEAKEAIRGFDRPAQKRQMVLHGAFWSSVGAMVTGVVWLLTVLL